MKARRWIAIIGGFLFLALSFNNCSQPGELALSAAETPLESLNDSTSGDSTNPPNNDSSPSYINKLKSVFVSGPSTNKVDILFVIDNSGSMESEQRSMSDRFPTLLDQIKGLDWKIGIITTDMSVTDDSELKNGKLIALEGLDGRRFMESSRDSARVESVFRASIQREESGSSNEQGIKATYRALQRSLKSSDANSGFIRPDAALAVVLISDADETPRDGYFEKENIGSNLASYVSSTWAGKAFQYNPIIVKSGDTVCRNQTNESGKRDNEDYGVNYEKLAKLTGGRIGSVCESDYSNQLAFIGQGMNELVNAVSLDCAPVDANGDGFLDIRVSDASGGLITNFEVRGTTVTFTQALPVGEVRFSYVCLSTK